MFEQNLSSIYQQIQRLSGNILPTLNIRPVLCVSTSPPHSCRLEAATAWHSNEKSDLTRWLCFSINTTSECFIVPAIVRVPTIGLKRSFSCNVCKWSPTYSPPSLQWLFNTSCRHLRHFWGVFFILNEPNENRCCLVSFFEEMRTACASYSKSLPSVRWTPRSSLWQLNMRGWQYKQRWIDAFPRGEDKEGLRGRQRVREGKKRLRDEGGNATGSVTVSCRLVSSFLPSALGRSLAHNMESINPHRIPLSPPDTCPVCLPLSVCFYMLLIDVYLGSWKSS